MKMLFLVLGLVALLLLAGCVSDEGTTGGSSTSSAGGKVYTIGEKFTLGDLSYVLNGIDQTEALGTEYINKVTEGMYYVVEFTIENNGTSEKSITPSNDFTVIAENGKTYKPSLELAIYAKTTGYESFAIIEKLQPGVPKTGVVVFEMPKGTKGKLKVKPGWFSGEVLVEFS